MEVNEILEIIWQMKWHEVFRIALMDDFIFLCKLWPLWLALGVGFIAVVVLKNVR